MWVYKYNGKTPEYNFRSRFLQLLLFISGMFRNWWKIYKNIIHNKTHRYVCAILTRYMNPSFPDRHLKVPKYPSMNPPQKVFLRKFQNCAFWPKDINSSDISSTPSIMELMSSVISTYFIYIADPLTYYVNQTCFRL